MANHLIQARVSNELKTQADLIFSSMGMTTSDAIRIFLQQSVNAGGLPFQPTAKIPNAETIAAMSEKDHKKGKTYNNTEELFKDLDI